MNLLSARISCACEIRRRVRVWHAGAFYARILGLISSTCTVHNKSSRVCIKTRSPPASLPFTGQVTKKTTVKWSIVGATSIDVSPQTITSDIHVWFIKVQVACSFFTSLRSMSCSHCTGKQIVTFTNLKYCSNVLHSKQWKSHKHILVNRGSMLWSNTVCH